MNCAELAKIQVEVTQYFTAKLQSLKNGLGVLAPIIDIPNVDDIIDWVKDIVDGLGLPGYIKSIAMIKELPDQMVTLLTELSAKAATFAAQAYLSTTPFGAVAALPCSPIDLEIPSDPPLDIAAYSGLTTPDIPEYPDFPPT